MDNKKRIDELLEQPCDCESLPHACDRCKELAELLNPAPPSDEPVTPF